MTDYHPLIARAVDGLERSTGEARRALYERARTALVTQLRGVDPPLSESEITKERLALEDAIRKVEADAARKARAEPRAAVAPPPRRDRPPADIARPDGRRAEPAMPRSVAAESGRGCSRRARRRRARERLLNARSPTSTKREGTRSFRDAISDVHDLGGATAKAAQSARETRDLYAAPPELPSEEVEPAAHNDFGMEGDADDLSAEHYDPRSRNRSPSFDDHGILHASRGALHGLDDEVEHGAAAGPRLSRDSDDRGGADHRRRSRCHGRLAVAAHHRGLSLCCLDRGAAAEPAKRRNGVAA